MLPCLLDRAMASNDKLLAHDLLQMIKQNGRKSTSTLTAPAPRTAMWERSSERLTWPSSRALRSLRSDAGKLRSWLPDSMVERP
jgi:hypothetical protein